MPKHGKKYNEAVAKVNSNYATLEEAINAALTASFAKFDETVEVALRLGVDPRHADQMVRGSVVLPNGTGRTVRVAVFAKGEKELEAQAAGADFVGAEDLIQKVQDGWLDFDKAIATPDMMGPVGKIAKILGPRGMMPNAKIGTVTTDVAKAVQDLKAGKIEFRVEKAGIVHAPMGKVSFGTEKLLENIRAFVDIVARMKPASSKGTYMKTLTISTTMGPACKLDLAGIRDMFK